MKSILDEPARCALCGLTSPVGDMTMNDDELWECDDATACEARKRCGEELTALGWPLKTAEPQAPADEQIRAYLDTHSDAFRAFLRREVRRDPEWFRAYLRKETRIAGRFPFEPPC